MKEAVLWDLDGVIINSEPFYYWSMLTTFRQHQVHFDETIFQNEFSGRPARAATINLLNNLERVDEVEAIWADKKALEPEFKKKIQVYKDADNAIAIFDYSLCRRQALVTGYRQPLINEALVEFSLDGFFETIVESVDYSDPKPSPEPYLVALSRLKIKPEDAVVIEDTPVGIQSAKSAGILTIAVSHTFTREHLNKADFVVDSLDSQDFFDFFKSA